MRPTHPTAVPRPERVEHAPSRRAGRPGLAALAALGVLLAVSAAGCGRSSGEGPHAIPPPFTPAGDVQFIDALVPHHEMAMRMADDVIARGANAEVRAMAQRMKSDQAREVEAMRAARRELTGDPQSPPRHDPRMAEEMARMAAASGAELDAMFLAAMIPHHAGGIEMAHRALPNLRRADLRAIATTMQATQAREIGEMARMREPARQ